MKSRLSELFGIDRAIFAFTYQPEVAAAVTKAGGMGVLGALRFTGDELEEALQYMDAECDGRPYGVDIVTPVTSLAKGNEDGFDASELEANLKAMIPQEHWDFVNQLLDDHGVPREVPGEEARQLLGWTSTTQAPQVEVSLNHDIALLASALGPPPKEVIDACHAKGVKVAALIGRTHQALKQQAEGVDIVIAQGTEAGGHSGDVASMVLWPEVVDVVDPDTYVLAAGGVGCGRQIAAAEALGADGVWMGSLWLNTTEHATGMAPVEKIHAATSSDTIRSRAMTGKPARQLKTAWIEAWERADTPDPLGMPLQYMLASEANRRIAASDADALKGTPIGQIVGRMNESRPVADVIADLVEEYEATISKLAGSRATI